jgi:hypothetical protein
VGNSQSHNGVGRRDTVDLLHDLKRVVQVFDDVKSIDLRERRIGERTWNAVEIMHDVGVRSARYVHVDRTVLVGVPGPELQDARV